MGVRPTVAATAPHPFTSFGVRCPQEGDPAQQTTNDVLEPCGQCYRGCPRRHCLRLRGRGMLSSTRRRRAVAVDDPGTSTAAVAADWPRLRVADWAATRDTLHMWTQVVGKIRLAKSPMLNHWWQTPLYVTPRGLTTSSIPDGRRLFDIEMDFRDASMRIRTSDGGCRAVALEPRSVADFYAETMAALRELEVDVAIRPVPVEVPLAVPFAQDTEHASYDAAAVRLFWGQLVQAEPGDHGVPLRVRRQGQPGALLLGQLRPRLHPVLRSDRAAAPRWRAQLCGLGDGGGLLPRAEQLRVLARRRRGGCVLRLCLPGAGGVPLCRGAARGPPATTRGWGSSFCRTRTSGPRPTPTGHC